GLVGDHDGPRERVVVFRWRQLVDVALSERCPCCQRQRGGQDEFPGHSSFSSLRRRRSTSLTLSAAATGSPCAAAMISSPACFQCSCSATVFSSAHAMLSSARANRCTSCRDISMKRC